LSTDIDHYAEDIVRREADVSNSPALITRFGLVAINSAVEMDGHVNSTHGGDTVLVGGPGGSGDFARHSLLSLIALPATAADGEISRTVPFVIDVDHTE